VPLSHARITLDAAYRSLRAIALRQREVPLLVQLVENPRFDLPGIEIFSGATNLRAHDYLHIVLGRGLLPKDEAFVLGFTMGSTNRVGAVEETLFTLIARYLYPKSYRFDDEDVAVYKDAVRLGYVSDCKASARRSASKKTCCAPITRSRRSATRSQWRASGCSASERAAQPSSRTFMSPSA
jgi:hypothetical protein